MNKTSKGITLIALVITIIVLLILAGITINFVIGENGIIGKASEAKEVARGANIEDQRNLWKINNETAKYTGGNIISRNEILAELQKERLLTEEEVKYIKNEDSSRPNRDNVITIGGKTISFKEEDIMEDESWNDSKGVNSPNKTEDMAMIAWNSGNIEIPVTKEEDWYNYDTQKWANAKTSDGSYWVWIPRYAYKITGQTIDIKFLQGTTNKIADGSEVPSDYKIHPAFQDGSSNNFVNGEWKKEIPGIWVAKFEMSREDSNDGGVTFTQTTKAGNVATVKTGTNQIRAVSKPRSKYLDKYKY